MIKKHLHLSILPLSCLLFPIQNPRVSVSRNCGSGFPENACARTSTLKTTFAHSYNPPTRSPKPWRRRALLREAGLERSRITFAHSYNPPTRSPKPWRRRKLSEPAETERRRATFTHSDNPPKLSEHVETERRRVTFEHSYFHTFLHPVHYESCKTSPPKRCAWP